jgi:hypothetical protein
MKAWLLALPIEAQIIMGVVYVIVQSIAVIVAKDGWGKWRLKKAGKGCATDINIHEHKKILYKQKELILKMHHVDDLLLSNQMRKTLEIFDVIKFPLSQSYKKEVQNKNKLVCSHTELSCRGKTLEPIIYSGLIAAAFVDLADTMRDIYKENGYHHLEGSNWEDWKKDKTTFAITFMKMHVSKNYPEDLMTISLIDRYDETQDFFRSIRDDIYEMFNYVQKLHNIANAEKQELINEFNNKYDINIDVDDCQ